jgi:hypothetical protein
MTLGNIAHQLIGQKNTGTRGFFRAFGGRGHAAGPACFPQYHHLHQLVVDVGGIFKSLVFLDQF